MATVLAIIAVLAWGGAGLWALSLKAQVLGEEPIDINLAGNSEDVELLRQRIMDQYHRPVA